MEALLSDIINHAYAYGVHVALIGTENIQRKFDLAFS